MIEVSVGLAGIAIGTIIGAVAGHLFAARRGLSEARRRVLSEELNRLYAPIDQLLELVGSAVDAFYWPHSSKYARHPSVCNRIKADIERTRILAGEAAMTDRLGLTKEDYIMLLELVQLANDMAEEHDKGNVVPEDMAEKVHLKIGKLRGRILDHKLDIIKS